MARFGEVVTAMVTPFDDELALDVDAAVALARWLADHGSAGLVLAGTTGESPTLSDAELAELWRSVAEAVTIPVLAGTGTSDTRHTVELTRLATTCGVDGVLVVTPYYSRPSQAGLESHFRSVAAATDLPVMIYDIPVRTGRKVDTAVLLRLAREVPNVVAVKDAAGRPDESARLIAEAPGGFELYSGDDALTLPLLAVGAVGVVSVAANWAGQVVAEMVAAHGKGDLVLARERNVALLPSFAFQSTDDAPNPLPAKAALRALGQPVGTCRPPLGPEPDGLAARAAAVLEGLRG